MDRPGYVYIMASGPNGTLYIGSTDSLPRRAWQHREGIIDGFTKRYGCKLLVWYEEHENLSAARYREKQMKEWQRSWKIKRIEATNPKWRDLASDLIA